MNIFFFFSHIINTVVGHFLVFFSSFWGILKFEIFSFLVIYQFLDTLFDSIGVHFYYSDTCFTFSYFLRFFETLRTFRRSFIFKHYPLYSDFFHCFLKIFINFLLFLYLRFFCIFSGTFFCIFGLFFNS